MKRTLPILELREQGLPFSTKPNAPRTIIVKVDWLLKKIQDGKYDQYLDLVGEDGSDTVLPEPPAGSGTTITTISSIVLVQAMVVAFGFGGALLRF
jgi:hypothetical protein